MIAADSSIAMVVPTLEAASVEVCWNVAAMTSGPVFVKIPLEQEATPVDELTATDEQTPSSSSESEKSTNPLVGIGDTVTETWSSPPTSPDESADEITVVDAMRSTVIDPDPEADK